MGLAYADYKLLGRAFYREVTGMLPLQVAKNNKRVFALEESGYLEQYERNEGATRNCPFALHISGWQLTHLGSIACCEWESKNAPPEE